MTVCTSTNSTFATARGTFIRSAKPIHIAARTATSPHTAHRPEKQNSQHVRTREPAVAERVVAQRAHDDGDDQAAHEHHQLECEHVVAVALFVSCGGVRETVS